MMLALKTLPLFLLLLLLLLSSPLGAKEGPGKPGLDVLLANGNFSQTETVLKDWVAKYPADSQA